MTVVIDTEQEEFVRNLALSEIEKLNVDVSDFIRKHRKHDVDKIKIITQIDEWIKWLEETKLKIIKMKVIKIEKE